MSLQDTAILVICLPDNLVLKSGELLSASLAVSLSVEMYTFK